MPLFSVISSVSGPTSVSWGDTGRVIEELVATARGAYLSKRMPSPGAAAERVQPQRVRAQGEDLLLITLLAVGYRAAGDLQGLAKPRQYDR